MASSAIKARNHLPEDARLKYVYEANAADRRLDQRWHDYVNLSVTNINPWMFRFSMREHEGVTWVILEFGPKIFGDPGVVFCTTNNIYPAAHRGRGLQGFEQMFAPMVPGRYQHMTRATAARPIRRRIHRLRCSTPSNSLSTTSTRSPFETARRHDAVFSALNPFPHQPKIELDPEAFR